MLSDKIIHQKADDLLQQGLIDYILTTGEEYRQAIAMIEQELATITDLDDRIKLIDRIVSDLKYYQAEHKKECQVPPGEICYFELHYDEVLAFLSESRMRNEVPSKNPESQTSNIESTSKTSDAPTATLQKRAIWAGIVMTIIAIIVSILLAKGII